MTRHFLLSCLTSALLVTTTQAMALPPAHKLNLPTKPTFSQATLDKVHQFQAMQQERLKGLSLSAKSLTANTGTIAVSDFSNDINFLDLQLFDAINYLISIKQAAFSTRSILLDMRELAIQVTNGTYGQNYNDRYNQEFQGYKAIFGFVQHVDLYAGEKIVSGGSIHLNFEDNSGGHDAYTVALPAFDLKALSLDQLNILSQANAQQALDQLQNAIETLDRVTIQMDNYLDDLESLILSIPSVLLTDNIIFNRMIEIAMQAANDTYGPKDKALLDMQFATLKQEMEKSQIIPTLNGPMNMTGGQLRIQVGEDATPERVLTIRLPDVNLVDLSLDRSHVDTRDNAYATLDALQEAVRHFVYY